MNASRSVRIMQSALALLAALFGVLTVFAGTRVLLGADPGYVVFRPLLLFNTLMGFLYLLAALTIWRNVRAGRYAAAAIFVLNLLVLAAVAHLYTAGQAVALDSVRAMTLRTGVWLALWFGLMWLSGRSA